MAPALQIATAATSLLAGITSLPSSPATPSSRTFSSDSYTVTIPVVLPPSPAPSSPVPRPPKSPHGTGQYGKGACKPNFQGYPVNIVNSASKEGWHVPKGCREGTPVSMQNGTDTGFRLEFTGQPQNDYIIKLHGVPDNGLLVQSFNASMLELCDVLPVNSPSFHLSCDSCGEPGTVPCTGAAIATGCTIRDKSTGKYVTGDGQDNLAGLSQDCNEASARFDFIGADPGW